MDETLQRTLIWAGFSLALTLLGLWRPNVGRAVIGLFFLLMAIMVNLSTTFTNPQSYVAWADTALLPTYREIILRLVAPNPALFVLPVAAYEIAVAVALVWEGRAVKLGLVGAMLFLIAGLALLLRHDYPSSIPDLVRGWLHRPPPAPHPAPQGLPSQGP